MFRRGRKNYRWEKLATYNAERARGLVHTDEWQRLMVKEQNEFNKERDRNWR